MNSESKGFKSEDVELIMIQEGLHDTATLVGRLAKSREKAVKSSDNLYAASIIYTDAIVQDIAGCLAKLERRIVELESSR